MAAHTTVHVIRHLVIYLLVCKAYVQTRVPNYCLQPLNTSDCHLKPTVVFSYYKSGSRCEMQTWRGCPTYNKFDNEYDCSDLCIFHLRRRTHKEPSDIENQDRESFLEVLMEVPEDNLTVVDDIVKEINEDVVKLTVNITDFADLIEASTSPSPETQEAESTNEAQEEEYDRFAGGNTEYPLSEVEYLTYSQMKEDHY